MTQITSDPSDEGGPAWSPDGTRIAFGSNRSGNSDIWVMNADGSNPVRLTFSPSEEGGPTWSPDGQWILFDTNRYGGNEELHRIPAAGGTEVRVTYNDRRELESSWAFAGNWVVCHSWFFDWEIAIYDAFTGVLVHLVTDHPAHDVEPGFAGNNRVVFQSNRSGNLEIWLAPIPAGQSGTQVTFWHGDDIQPNWSPVQNLISFVSDRLWIANEAPSDGLLSDEELAYLHTDIWITNETGTFVVAVTTDGLFNSRGRWSPDGERILFQSHRTGNWDIYIADDLPLQVPVEETTWGAVKARFADK